MSDSTQSLESVRSCEAERDRVEDEMSEREYNQLYREEPPSRFEFNRRSSISSMPFKDGGSLNAASRLKTTSNVELNRDVLPVNTPDASIQVSYAIRVAQRDSGFYQNHSYTSQKQSDKSHGDIAISATDTYAISYSYLGPYYFIKY